MNRPHTAVILAMSADGKIADADHRAARFSSPVDRSRLEKLLSEKDAALFGAATLRAYGTSLSIRHLGLLHQRQQRGLPPQPIQIVCSGSGKLDPEYKFFRQPFPRWLLTTVDGAKEWQKGDKFDHIFIHSDWIETFRQFTRLGIKKLAILGGGQLIASLLAQDLIDEFYLTLCPVILGGANAPTPVDGLGFMGENARKLELLTVETIEQEIFLHYRVIPSNRTQAAEN